MKQKKKKITHTNKQNVKGKLLSKWKDVKLSNKYLAVFSFTIALFLIGSIIVFLQLNKTQTDMEAITEQNDWVNDMTQVVSFIQLKDVQIADYLLTQRTAYIDAYSDYSNQINELFEVMEPTLQTEEQKEIFTQIMNNDQSMNQILLEEMVPAIDEGRTAFATSQRNYSTNLRLETTELANQLIENVKSTQEQTVASANRNINTSIIILVVSNLLVIVLGTILMVYISRKISTYLSQLVGATTQAANGDLTIDTNPYVGKDEIGQLFSAVNIMKDNMRGILSNVSQAAKAVQDSGEALTISSREVKEGNIQIAQTMEELSSGAETQANGASDLAEQMKDFVDKVNDSEQYGVEITSQSDNVLSLTKDGTTLMEKSVDQMKHIDTIVSDSVSMVQSLDKQSAEISHLVSVIKDIADQTNLLSLNAAIEAARAGEHGKGFAVVADEVRKLSEQVASSVGEITSIVTSIQQETKRVVNSLHTGYDAVHEGTNRIEATGQNFETIHQAVLDMAEKISSISTNLKSISLNSQSMNGTIEEIASVSEESAAGVEEAAASSQQTASSMEEVTNRAEQLEELSEQLMNELKIFKL
ncbi:methyl-accepting chemotaxis protein [Oceanobacillus piezotolerans]|uniref:Methyl-accepting chemotaxis protein n=1 Tax=Oceanobacillus piezotolerans TaxID=2448030 RepID=A0A498DAP8_9BACI|nr:methyl-accepting chemotaxis protein [Oceanobacillus piezotolerans]RLL42058.1 methyl-accepting chemotaxis protein [Oceanobacillus piezotolerans]